jgi:flagellar motor switch protein FliG
MKLSGIQKAALLLTTLDSATAMELLKGQSQETLHQIAMALSQWDVRKDKNPEQAVQITREFCTDLMQARGGLHIKSFVGNLLQGGTGKEKAAELHEKMKQSMIETDPFLVISEATPLQLAAALENEPPQAIAVVLSLVPPRLGTEVLSRLSDEKAQLTVWRMTQGRDVSGKTVRRIGEMICRRLKEMASDEGLSITATVPKETLRKVAQVLSGLDKEKRDSFLGTIKDRDDSTALTVRALMITWEDITKIEDKSLQQVLRNIEATVLAKALHGADPIIAEKIRSNISERMSQMVEEEAQLMGEPRRKDVLVAREQVVQPLREANEQDALAFIEEEAEVFS